MIPLVTFITPLANYHRHLEPRIRAIVAAQTTPCLHITVHDKAARGAGWARNRGLEQVMTDYVCFLDADDSIAPDFVARCLAARRRYHYVFTDIRISESTALMAQRYGFNDDATRNERWHAVTTLCPTAFWRAIGGFDETLPAMEDTDAYMRLEAAGYCGQRLPEPLFTYGSGGARGASFNTSPDKRRVMDLIYERHGGKMGCCGDDGITPLGTNDKQDGDVLVQAAWNGNQVKRGVVTGRLYPRVGYPRELWVAEADADARPDWFRRVVRVADPMDTPPLTFRGLDSEIRQGWVNAQYPPMPIDTTKIVTGERTVIPPEKFEQFAAYLRDSPQRATRSVDTMSPTMAALAPKLGTVAPRPPHDAMPPDADTMTRQQRAQRVTERRERGMR